MSARARLRRALRDPFAAWGALLAIARGQFYKIWYPLRGVRFSAGRGFRVSGKLLVRGPGTVRFGDGVHIGMTVTPFTYAPQAVIEAGSHTFLNGTRFGCVERISIGEPCIVAECRIMDTSFHSLHANRHDPEAPVKVAPVAIDDTAWVAADASILPGTHIGSDSVVGIGSVCRGEIPAGVIVAGNPGLVVGRVPGAAAEAKAVTIRTPLETAAP